jgi:hypothetical protein
MQMMAQPHSGFPEKDINVCHWTAGLVPQRFQSLHNYPVTNTPNLPKVTLDLVLPSGRLLQKDGAAIELQIRYVVIYASIVWMTL